MYVTVPWFEGEGKDRDYLHFINHKFKEEIVDELAHVVEARTVYECP